MGAVRKKVKTLYPFQATKINQTPTNFWKDGAPVIATHLSKIIDPSFKFSIFPLGCIVAELLKN